MSEGCDKAPIAEQFVGGSERNETFDKLHDEINNLRDDSQKNVPVKPEQDKILAAPNLSLPDLSISGMEHPTADGPSSTINKRFWHDISREWLGLPNTASQEQVAKACEGYGKDSSMFRFYDQLRTEPRYATEVRDQLNLPHDASQKVVNQAFDAQQKQFAREMGLPENAPRVLMDDLVNYADQKETARKLGLPELDLRNVDAAGASRDLSLQAREHHIDQALQFADLNLTLGKMGEKALDMEKIPDDMRSRVLDAQWSGINRKLNEALNKKVEDYGKP